MIFLVNLILVFCSILIGCSGKVLRLSPLEIVSTLLPTDYDAQFPSWSKPPILLNLSVSILHFSQLYRNEKVIGSSSVLNHYNPIVVHCQCLLIVFLSFHARLMDPCEKALPFQMSVELVWNDSRLKSVYQSEKEKLKERGFQLKEDEEVAFRLLISNDRPLIWIPQVQINSFVRIPLMRDYSQMVLKENGSIHFMTR